MHNPLSQKGHRQAKALARRIQSEGIESLYASNYRKEGQASGQRQQDRVFRNGDADSVGKSQQPVRYQKKVII